MKEKNGGVIMMKSWWKVPVYCIISGWISFQLMVRFLLQFGMEKLPDGTLLTDDTKVLLVQGFVFALVVGIGGIYFFRKIQKRELFISASIWVAVGLGMYFVSSTIPNMEILSWYHAVVNSWSDFVPQALMLFPFPEILITLLSLCAPYIFVLFGKKKEKEYTTE